MLYFLKKKISRLFVGDISPSLIGAICQEISRVEKQLGVHITQRNNKEINEGGIHFYSNFSFF
jgi:hypothetical protein